MMTKNVLVLGVVLSIGATPAAFADTNHSNEAKTEMESADSMDMQTSGSQMGMMGGNHHDMMRMMMRMHGNMMAGGSGQAGMMDRDMIAMIVPWGGQQDITKSFAEKVQEFDSDGNGVLTLEEFEALHMRSLRDQMVDRFQHLDADADGQITASEIANASARMAKMKNATMGSGMEDHQGDDTE